VLIGSSVCQQVFEKMYAFLVLIVLEKEIGISLELCLEPLPPPIKSIRGDRHGLVPPCASRVEGQHEIIEILGNLLRHQRPLVVGRLCVVLSERFVVDVGTSVAIVVGQVLYDIDWFDRYSKVDRHDWWRLLPIEADEFLALGPARPKDVRLFFRRNQ